MTEYVWMHKYAEVPVEHARALRDETRWAEVSRRIGRRQAHALAALEAWDDLSKWAASAEGRAFRAHLERLAGPDVITVLIPDDDSPETPAS